MENNLAWNAGGAIFASDAEQVHYSAEVREHRFPFFEYLFSFTEECFG